MYELFYQLDIFTSEFLSVTSYILKCISNIEFLAFVLALLPCGLMVLAMGSSWLLRKRIGAMWCLLVSLCTLAASFTILSLAFQLISPHFLLNKPALTHLLPGMAIGITGAWLALLVQCLGVVIASFSSRYLQGEPGQGTYATALAAVLAAVQLLVLADHWAVLIVAWAAAGVALERLLCFYGDRPFALLAAHKKFIADRLADVLLVVAACLAVNEVGTGSISEMLKHVEVYGAGTSLCASAVLLVLAVAIRCAMLPLHGWLIQVMEAPTPVSALLHAGVVNLGGYVLIRFAPLLEAVSIARWVLLCIGAITAVLAGFVMLTRISIKVRLAWSTVAQMGFMLLECAVGLYQLAALHLLGHSLYKAYAFLSSGEIVRQTTQSQMRGVWAPSTISLMVAPVIAAAVVPIAQWLAVGSFIVWPWWWNAVLALAWAPLLWLRADDTPSLSVKRRLLTSVGLVVLFTWLAVAGHALPVGVLDQAHHTLGVFVLVAMGLMYIGTAVLQVPDLAGSLEPLRRQSYAGFYLDEAYTRLALWLWPERTPIKRTENNAHIASESTTDVDILIEQACEQACKAIAPVWPLDQSIAVNPHWGRIALPMRTVAARMALLGGVQVYPSRQYMLQAWNEGRITAADLDQAIAQVSATSSLKLDKNRCVDGLSSDPLPEPLPLLIDLLDDGPNRTHRLSWRQAITHQLSQTCAAYFDQHQADWHPQRQQGLYAFWRETLLHDHGIGILMGLPHLKRQLANLPETPEQAVRWVIERLGLPSSVRANYLEALLLTVNGWASWCAYLGWQAALQGGTDKHLRELLAIRLAWGAILLDGENTAHVQSAFDQLKQHWSNFNARLLQAETDLLVDEIWQTALECSYQRGLATQLKHAVSANIPARTERPPVQAVFCIDVRSEPIRRALEGAVPNLQTIGFAGFFGLPIAYTPIGTVNKRPQLPGLLAPSLEITDEPTNAMLLSGEVPTREGIVAERQRHFSISEQWRSASRWPAAAFSFVETFGWLYARTLFKSLRIEPKARKDDDLLGVPVRFQSCLRPSLAHLELSTRVELAAKLLNAMGLTQQLAPIVLLVGHGSQSRNNAHAAALNCGACGGQTGQVNARVLAQMLNDDSVRDGLHSQGFSIPVDTVFVAALHNTSTDELEWFDCDLLSLRTQNEIEQLRTKFACALDQVRRERAPSLGLNSSAPAKSLFSALRRRANDGAQTRPEWGLAGNAAFVIAPRRVTHTIKLNGRSFLHDYDAATDYDGALLEQLLTAPMLVTHWINFQYHASSCEPNMFGSGNKVLHNIVGGRIGVFEGNGGDLRIGLSKQSLYYGDQCNHEPLRLTVVIAAPQSRISAIFSKHTVLQQLVHNGWLHIWQLEGRALSRYEDSRWEQILT